MEGFKDVSLQHDPRWTAEAFANVMDNAVKYSPENLEYRYVLNGRYPMY